MSNASMESRLDKTLDRLERKRLWLLGCWTVFYLVVACVLTQEKPFWNDELFTFYISRQPRLPDVWSALLTGAEQIPPLFFMITRTFTAVLGPTQFGFRLPEILGFWLMSVSMFHFVRARSSATCALIAMTFPMVTAAFDYAYEARPYAIVLGFCALALCCWQVAAQNRVRSLSLLGLALSTAVSVSCHYYAILGVSAIVTGECARSIRKKRVDFAMWAAFVLGVLPLVFFLPLIEAARSYSREFWSKPQWINIFGFYNLLLTPTVLALFLILIVLGTCTGRRFSAVGDCPPGPNNVPLHEKTAVLALVVVPVIAILLGKLVTGAYNFRYALTALIGLSILLSWSLSRLGHRRVIGAAVIPVLMGFSLVNGMRAYLRVKNDHEARASTYQFLSTESVGAPVIIAAPHLFLEMSHDLAERKVTNRFIYLADTPLALKYTKTDTVERGLLAFKRWAPLDVRNFRQFVGVSDAFLVYSGCSDPFGWVIEELIREKRRLLVRAQNGDQLLFLVTK
jgi:4-amino-4-deoxy-L-arabinose transferase-like glycosyltransferase